MRDANGSGEKTSGSAQGENFDQLPASVIEERRHIIEAALVRIMKARKALSHNDLIAEVLRQVSHRFTVEVTVSLSRKGYVVSCMMSCVLFTFDLLPRLVIHN